MGETYSVGIEAASLASRIASTLDDAEACTAIVREALEAAIAEGRRREAEHIAGVVWKAKP